MAMTISSSGALADAVDGALDLADALGLLLIRLLVIEP
jgi:hypothetical protein